MQGWVISKQVRHKRVSRMMIRAKQMYATVSDGRDEEFAESVGWLNPIPHLQKDAREFTEKLAKFVTFSSRVLRGRN